MMYLTSSRKVALSLLLVACLFLAASSRPLPTTAGLLDSSSTFDVRSLLQPVGSIETSTLRRLMAKPVNQASQKALNALHKVGHSLFCCAAVARCCAAALPAANWHAA
jgi:hypothetical protein